MLSSLNLSLKTMEKIKFLNKTNVIKKRKKIPLGRLMPIIADKCKRTLLNLFV